MIELLKQEINRLQALSIFNPSVNSLDNNQWLRIIEVFEKDYSRYYHGELIPSKIKYFPGLLATFCYSIARELYLSNNEEEALEFSSLGFSLTSIEIYYTSQIGSYFKINHGIGTVIGAHTKIGNNALLHHSITIGEKNGGRAEIGNKVIIYPGTIIVGPIKIGDNSIIGANLFIDKSYPDNSIINQI